MKENKFRAWDDVEGKFRTLLDLGDVSGEGSVQFSVGYAGELQIGRLEEFHNGVDFDSKFTKFPVIQYTGLQDKNGKEIYEGDVVTFKYDTRSGGGYTRLIHRAAIEYGGKGGDYMRAGYTFKFDDARGNEVVYDLEWLKVRNIEVIGNIYENPELLEESQNGTK